VAEDPGEGWDELEEAERSGEDSPRSVGCFILRERCSEGDGERLSREAVIEAVAGRKLKALIASHVTLQRNGPVYQQKTTWG
jgi:hypothetical protein